MLDSVFTGGLGGEGGSNPCATAPNGQNGGSGVPPALLIPGLSRSLAPIECASEGGSIRLSFRGQPGDRAYLGIATHSAYAFVPSLHGPLLLIDQPLRSKFIGVLDGRGFLDAQLPVTELGPGVQAIVRQAQGILVGVDGAKWLTGSSPIVRLDSGI